MELVFQENRLEYLSRILCETVTQEQTAELIMPDTYSDADRVVDAFGTALVRSEECSAGSAAVSGLVQVGVLIVTENEEVQRLEAQLPFSVRKEFELPQDECTMQCRCAVRGVDARMLNSRKLLVRVNVSCTIAVYVSRRQMTYDMPEAAPTLQLKRTELPLRVPTALGEKSFVLNEEIELPAGRPALERLLKCTYRTEVLEQKMVGSKAVFKGNLAVHMLYENPEGGLETWNSGIPFSQYVDMESAQEDSDLQTILTLTAAETEPDGQMDCRRVLLSVNLLAQCTAYGQQKVTLIEDAYCTDAEFTPQWNEWEMWGVLDRQSFRGTAQADCETPAGKIIDACVCPEEAIKRRQGDRMMIELPLVCNLLYTDPEGALQGRSLRPTFLMETELAENGSCRVANVGTEEVFCNASGNGMEVRCPVSAEVECAATHRLRGVCGGSISEEKEDAGRRASVILRRTESDEDVWDIAKACRTPVRSVLEANDLEGTQIPAGTMLLIPMT